MMTRLALSIDAAHPAFAGHFPARPIVPGVVLLDRSLRAIAANFGLDDEAIASTICRIGAAKFLSPVGPGEALRLEVEATSRAGSASVAALRTTSTAPSARAPAPTFITYTLRVFAGEAAGERLAMTGTVSFEPRDADAANAASTPSSTSV